LTLLLSFIVLNFNLIWWDICWPFSKIQFLSHLFVRNGEISAWPGHLAFNYRPVYITHASRLTLDWAHLGNIRYFCLIYGKHNDLAHTPLNLRSHSTSLFNFYHKTSSHSFESEPCTCVPRIIMEMYPFLKL